MELDDEVRAWTGARRLMSTLPRGSELRRMKKAGGGRALRLRCDRSLPFEFIAEFLDPYLSLWGARAELSLSDYDPALSQLGEAAPCDVRILFLDWRLNKLPPAQAASFIRERAREAAREAPVLLNNWPASHELNERLAELRVPGLTLIDLHALKVDFDPRNDSVSNFPFSGPAAVAIARHLALDLLPPLAGERIKGVILDLDDTLWRGVLGEEGPQGIVIGEGHRALSARLAALRKRGLMLAICSRNELEDVRAAFKLRSELGLSLDDFASVQVSWAPKVENIGAIARELNVHPSSLLFVDDNPAELAKARGAVEGLRVLLADPDGAQTAAALDHFPGIFAVSQDAAASVRTADVRANREREKLREQAGDPRAFLAALQMEVELFRNCAAHAQRIHELSQKTNQFNLALQRLSAAQAAEAVGSDQVTMTVSLRDALSESGLIGVLIARVEDGEAAVREVLFSCRVLGRDVETLSLLHFCKWLLQEGARRIRFEVAEGPRNHPARDWLACLLPQGPSGELSELHARLEERCRAHPATVVEHR